MTQNYCKVLIVDDEVLIRQGIKHFMNWEQEGFHIIGEASNGQEALEMIGQLRPHIVLTDIVMPVMDGEELTRQIKQHFPEIEVIVLSSFGEFDYVRSTFQSGVADYILKPKLDMQHLLTVLKLTAEKIPDLHARQASGGSELSLDMLLERMMSGYEVMEGSEAVAQNLPNPYFCLVGGSFKGQAEQWRSEFQTVKGRIAKLIQLRLPGGASHMLPTEGQLAVVLINCDRQGLAAIPGLARELTEVLSAESSRVPLVVSEPFNDFTQLGVVYREDLLKLIDYSFYFPGKPILSRQELPEPQHAPSAFNLNRFTEEFKRERFDTAFQYVEDHVRELAGCYTTDVYEFKAFLGNLVFNMTVLLSNMDYEVKELDRSKYAYFKAIEDSRYADDAIAKLNAFIGEAKERIADKAVNAGNANMKKLLDYIDEHYAEPLSLTEMARHFHFNPSYLSSYFSSHNSEGFVDYLHRVRTDKAAELLRQGEATISEISDRVGYSDHSYFTKVFKKLTGMSPSRYRRQYMK